MVGKVGLFFGDVAIIGDSASVSCWNKIALFAYGHESELFVDLDSCGTAADTTA